MSVSVALCTCNGAAFVAEQVRSILAQTHPVLEVVVHDDASDDDTLDVVQRAWSTHLPRARGTPQLRITRNAQRLGVARNFEAALRDCRGELIALCDQDDSWDPQRLEVLVPRFAQHPEILMVHGDAALIDAAGTPIPDGTLFRALGVSAPELALIEAGRGWEALLARNLVTGATAVLRSSLRDVALPIPAHWLHDEWLGMVAALLGGLAVERRTLLAYRQHGGNQVGAWRKGALREVVAAHADRGEWYAHRMHRADELAARMRALAAQVDPDGLAAVAQKAEHHRVRAQLPAARLRRIGRIRAEWKTGRYRRFGLGWRGALRDLL